MTLQDLDNFIQGKIFELGIFIPKENWLELMPVVVNVSYDDYGEFFWYMRNKFRPLPVPTMLVVNGERE